MRHLTFKVDCGQKNYKFARHTRKTTEAVGIMALEDYEALEETAYLLHSPKKPETHQMMAVCSAPLG
jgi:hypothetical protein